MDENYQIQLTGDSGAKVLINLNDLDISQEQKTLLKKVLIEGNLDTLNDDEKNKIKDMKTLVNYQTPLGAHQAFICRWDLSWVRIDE